MNQTYLNNAATTWPKPAVVKKAVADCIESIPQELGRGTIYDSYESVIDQARNSLRRLINSPDNDHIIFAGSGTDALNIALFGLNLSGRHVITTVCEHNSILRPLYELRRRGDISLSIIDANSNGEIDIGDVQTAMNSKTALVAVSHCSNVTGKQLDIRALSMVVHVQECLLLVDVSQSIGYLPVDVQRWNADLVAGAGHKGLFGIQGIGFLWVRHQGVNLRPWRIGGTGTRSDLESMPLQWPIRYEAGTHNVPAISSLGAGVGFLFSNDQQTITTINARRYDRFVLGINDFSSLKIIAPHPGIGHCPICLFTLDKMDPDDIGYALLHSFGITVRVGLHCAPLIHKALGTFPQGCVRVSISYLNSDDDIDIGIDAIQKIVRAKKTF